MTQKFSMKTLQRPDLNFPYPMGDKYYVVDVGYPNTIGLTLLRDMHVNYKYKNQVRIVIASMVIHNYIRKVGRFDETFNRAQQESYNHIRGGTSSEVYEECPSTRRMSDDDSYMAAIRDIIAQDIITLLG
ncbi:unnamed protein product [Lactuca virosa]|uniref:DDE Tnp4 domain-containing protein n=1 Tax=Lactuca virosa TaxID=75947 RepID=A0AAU9MMW3_9ASTR|nr:unnamed protein product [Lactuca virosa]